METIRRPGDAARLPMLLRDLEPRLRRLAARLRGHGVVGDTDDLVQIGLSAAWRLEPAFDASRGVSFATFVRKRAHYAMVEHCERERAAREVAALELQEEATTAEDQLLRHERHRSVHAACDALREADPTGHALLMRTQLGEEALTEAARALGVSYKQARDAVERAERRLGRELVAAGVER